MGEKGEGMSDYWKPRIMPDKGEDESEPSSFAGQEPPYEVGTTMRTSTGRTVRLMRYQKDKGLYHVMEFGENAIRPAWRVSPDHLSILEEGETK